MISPHDTVSAAMRAALKGGDRERVATLRLLLSEISNERIAAGSEVDETAFHRLVRRAVKQREDSAAQYEQGGREDLAAKERREAGILAEYLPEDVGDDELRAAIAEILAEEDLAGPAAMGPAMRRMMERFGGRADGGRINQLVREQLSGD